MEKKEKEELKERFMNLVVDDKREKITVKDLTATAMMIRSTPPDYSVLLNFIEKELDKAREEGREEGINAVLFPKFKRDKNGTLKREGWVDTSKLMRRTKMEKEEMSIYIWERVNMMSDYYHSEGGVVVVAKSLERAREIAREHFNPEEEHETLTDYDTTVFDTGPQKVFRVTSKEEYYCDFPDAGCC